MKAPAVAVLGGAAAVAAALIEYAQSHVFADALLAALAGLIAVGVAALALSLPGLGWRGLLTGGFFVIAGVLSWTFIDNGEVVWGFLVVEGLVFLAWGFPWLRDALRLPRLGAAWLGLAYWLLGVIGAVLVWRPVVAAERVAYAGVFTLAAVSVVAMIRRGRVPAAGQPADMAASATPDRGGEAMNGRAADPGAATWDGPGGAAPAGSRTNGEDLSVGVVAAFLIVIAALLLAGSGSVFQPVHPVPGGPQGALWGSHMQGRFWGGPLLMYHPNSIGLIAVLCGIRIGAGRTFALWQRLAAPAVTGLMLYLVVSRTALLYAGVAAGVHALLLWRRRGVELPVYRHRLVAAVVPFVMVGIVYVLLGGISFATQSRYAPPPTSASVAGPGASDPTSGRMDTWIEVGREWKAAGWAEKVFGDTKTSRAVVRRGPNSPKLTTDNAAVGGLRRGGVAGEIAFLAGLAILLVHASIGPRIRGRVPHATPPARPARRWRRLADVTGRLTAGRRVPPAWFTIAAVGSVSTIATSDWLLGGTGGTLWILLLVGEAALIYDTAPLTGGWLSATIGAPQREPITTGVPPRR